MIHRFGGNVTPIWTCGGPHGQLLKQLLDEIGLDHVPVPIGGMTRENLVVNEEAENQQYRFMAPGPVLDREEAEACLEALGSLDPVPGYVVLSGSLAPGLEDDFYARAAAACSGRVIVDTSGPALEAVLRQGIFLIKPNLRELGRLAGRKIEEDSEIESTARRLLDEGGTEAVVCSVGSGGAVLVTAGGTEFIRTPTVPIRSKVGAGDSTVAGILVGLTEGMDLGEAVRFGVAAGAAAVMTPASDLCHPRDVRHLFEGMQRK